jgi:hypothetical protein
MHYQQGGEKFPIHVSRGSLHRSREENLGENAFVQGELAFMHLGALFHLIFSSRALLPMASSPFASP